MNYTIDKLLYEVIYTNDVELLKPTILKTNDDKFSITLSDIGIYKNTYWSFQKEWRYRLMFLPFSTQKLINEHMQNRNDEMTKLQYQTIVGQAALPFSDFYLQIKDDCFSNMKITLSPDISESARIFVELLIREYNPTCIVEDSVLTNLIQ